MQIASFVLILAVASTGSPAQRMSEVKRPTRTEALLMLKKCESFYSKPCARYREEYQIGLENVAEHLISLYEHGDKELLHPLLDAGLKSDGALSQSLGSFYGELLAKHPKTFMTALVKRPVPEQRELAFMAGVMDGSGMPEDKLRKVRTALRQLAAQKQTRLVSVVNLCLDEVNKANRSNR